MDVRERVGNAVAEQVARSVAKKVATGVALFIGFVIFIIVGGFIVSLLWNWLVPDIFGLRRITFWEALGLLALSRILFGGFGRGAGSGGRGPRRERRDWWKKAHEDTQQQ